MEEFDACVTRIKSLKNLEVLQDAYINLVQSNFERNLGIKIT